MQRKPHHKANLLLNKFLLPLATFVVLLTGCGKGNDPAEPDPTSPGGPSATSTYYGEILQIPNINALVPGDFALNLKTTNEGLYMQVSTAKGNKNYIYRLQKGGPSPVWTIHEQPDLYFDWEPSKYVSEKPKELAIYFQTISKNGYVSINSDVPALIQDNNPANGISSFTGEMLHDNSSAANKFAFFGNVVKLKRNNNLNQWDIICTLPGTVTFAEADPKDAVIWAAGGKKLYKITASGSYTTFDVSSFNNTSTIGSSSIEKIRFSYDPIHKDVYFRCQNKVFKITDGKTLSLFYTIKNASPLSSGDFALDNSNLYASDGTKKSLSLLTEINILPSIPNTSDQAVFLHYVKVTTAFAVGPIEVLKDPLDNSIYCISGGDKLVKIPKNKP